MTNKISRLDRLTLWGTGLRTGLAAIAAAVMFGTGGLALAQEPTPPPITEAPVEAPAEAPVEVAPVEEVAEVAVEEEAPVLDTGNTAWMLTSTALVLMMTIPGLALFYGGMVRRKNVIATVTQSFAITALGTILWFAVSYSLAFSTNSNEALNPYIGGLDAMFLNGIAHDALFGSIPEYLFIVFQLTFAVITPALIAGAYAERMKFSAMLIFTALWQVLVYAPIAHWVWGGGWLASLGALDFAGGTVVHINAGIAGLMAAIVLGKRKGYPTENMAPHNLVYTMIGASLLWVGWFGFNAGSALAADALASVAMLNTQVATAAAALVFMFIEMILRRKATLLGLTTGAVAGLVAITPAAGFVNPMGAMIIGAAGGAAGYFGAVVLKKLLGYDDSLDAFGVHGIAGIVGAILTAPLADTAINAAGEGASIVTQLIAVGATIGYCAVASLVFLLILKFTIGIRVKPDQEEEGLDYALHGEALH